MNACWARHLTHISADVTCLSVFLWSLLQTTRAAFATEQECGGRVYKYRSSKRAWRQLSRADSKETSGEFALLRYVPAERRDCHRLKDSVKSQVITAPLGSRSACSPDGIAAACRSAMNPSDHGHWRMICTLICRTEMGQEREERWNCVTDFFAYSRKLLSLLSS
jgi:hypothetical protein